MTCFTFSFPLFPLRHFQNFRCSFFWHCLLLPRSVRRRTDRQIFSHRVFLFSHIIIAHFLSKVNPCSQKGHQRTLKEHHPEGRKSRISSCFSRFRMIRRSSTAPFLLFHKFPACFSIRCVLPEVKSRSEKGRQRTSEKHHPGLPRPDFPRFPPSGQGAPLPLQNGIGAGASRVKGYQGRLRRIQKRKIAVTQLHTIRGRSITRGMNTMSMDINITGR